MSHSEARERVLQAAERLFAQRGYTAVTIKDIAAVAGIHHASLYHHAPDGKEGLFVEVMTRILERHREGIADAVREGGADARGQLHRIAAWMIHQPPMDMVRMTLSDMPAIDPASATVLGDLAFEAMIVPIARVLDEARARGEIAHGDLGNIAGAIFSMLQGLHTLPEAFLERSRQEMANELIDVMLAGMKAR
jgi:AcrR family transcriptional regulator